MEFFIPYVKEDSSAQEAWNYYLNQHQLPPNTRPVYLVNYEKEGSRYEVTVGQSRKHYRRKTGPRGGYIKNADYQLFASDTGTMVTAIADSGGTRPLYVWSMAPYGTWDNPSFVGRSSVTEIEYFDQ